MMGEEARSVHVELTVLATSNDDSAAQICEHVIVGAADDEAALLALWEESDVVTFDHELVDLDLLSDLEERGVVFRPRPSALRYSVDKAFQREEFARAGFPVPRFVVVRAEEDLTELLTWCRSLDGPPVVKAARGGYDGRGVLFPSDADEAIAFTRQLLHGGAVVVEERIQLRSEVAQLAVRPTDGEVLTYPLVTTVQSAGMCAEVHFPCELDEARQRQAAELSAEIARHIDLVGVMAVEFFDAPEGLIINELALRPHNSGHWTIEGTTTSQFANHLRAVSGQGLGAVDATCRAAVMVNVVGAPTPGSLDDARHVPGVHVHDYGKAWRPGRKLGHVTAVGDDIATLHVRTWESARAYGTTAQEAS
jgi:5-(carboxyamino)imidazole ribonucleotide synthase